LEHKFVLLASDYSAHPVLGYETNTKNKVWAEKKLIA